jgi:predicted lipoprotein
LVGGKFYEPATPFKQWANTSTGGQMAGKLAAEPWANVFESYMEEKTKPVASVPQTVNVAPVVMEPGQVMTVPGGGTITRNK